MRGNWLNYFLILALCSLTGCFAQKNNGDSYPGAKANNTGNLGNSNGNNTSGGDENPEDLEDIFCYDASTGDLLARLRYEQSHSAILISFDPGTGKQDWIVTEAHTDSKRVYTAPPVWVSIVRDTRLGSFSYKKGDGSWVNVNIQCSSTGYPES